MMPTAPGEAGIVLGSGHREGFWVGGPCLQEQSGTGTVGQAT